MSGTPFSNDMTRRINMLIGNHFKDAITKAHEIDPAYEYLWQSLYDLANSGGKRLRPHMVVLAYEAFGGTTVERILPAAVAHELLHLSLLIHDDIIDRDYIRYGVPNIAGRYRRKYKAHLGSESERIHFAHGAAILAGDLVLTSSFQLVIDSRLTPKEKSIAQAMLTYSMFHVAGGELLDTEASFIPPAPGGALKTALYKTASYSFVSPLLTGARLAGISKTKEKHLVAYAEALGIAFQLVDDILGIFGDEQETGKSTSSDLREGKRTYMVEYAFATMSADEKVIFDIGFGNQNASPEALHRTKEFIISSGALDAAKALIKERSSAALDALNQLGLKPAWHQKFESLMQRITDRTF